jgi:tripartite-type tricarboxylate transporter receptor subunit TctC
MKKIFMVAAAALIACAAHAQAPAPSRDPFPCTTVRIVAPNPPGGATDVLSRMIATPLSQRIGVPVVVENKGGASTNIGNEFVVRSAPDGCTMLLGNISMALNKSLFKLNHDVEKDLRAVIQVAAVPVVLFVHPSVPARTMKEFIDWAKAQQGKVSFSSAGSGTPTHLIVEMLNGQSGAKIIHVPYKGAGPATMDVVIGQIQSSSDSLIPVVPHVRNGTVRALGVTGKERSTALPDVPTFTEQGFGYADISLWYGVMVPSKTPDAMAKRLNDEIAAVLATPEVQQRLVNLGSEKVSTSPDSFQALLRTETTRLGDLIRKANVTAD